MLIISDMTRCGHEQECHQLRRIESHTLERQTSGLFPEGPTASSLIPHVALGEEPSTHLVSQSGLLSYADTHRHRLGGNY